MDRDLPTGGPWHSNEPHDYVVVEGDHVPYTEIPEILLWMAFLGGFMAAWDEAEGSKDAAIYLRAHRAYQRWREEVAQNPPTEPSGT